MPDERDDGLLYDGLWSDMPDTPRLYSPFHFPPMTVEDSLRHTGHSVYIPPKMSPAFERLAMPKGERPALDRIRDIDLVTDAADAMGQSYSLLDDLVRRLADAKAAQEDAQLWHEARARVLPDGVLVYQTVRGARVAELVTPLYAEAVAEHNDRVSLATLTRQGWPVVVRAIERDHAPAEAMHRMQGMQLDQTGMQRIFDAAAWAYGAGHITLGNAKAIRAMARARMTA